MSKLLCHAHLSTTATDLRLAQPGKGALANALAVQLSQATATATVCQAKQTHWPITGNLKRCAAGRVNRAMLATVAVHGCKSACAGGSTHPKPPR